MAAVICQSIGDLCRGCGEICCLPCKACGVGCQCFWDMISSPFFPYLFITFSLNAPPFFLGIQSVDDLMGDCSDPATWMLINAACCAIHIVACLYIIHKVQHEEPAPQQWVPPAASQTQVATATVISASVYDAESKKETVTVAPVSTNLEAGTCYRTMSTRQHDNDVAPSNTWGRISHIMCYDKGVALYILVAIGWMIYQAVGVTKLITQTGSCGSIASSMLIALVCGWVYMCLVGCAFLCSMCCMRL